jgi:nitrogen fixation NifU-like protein
MSELNDLYQEVILDHTRHPHNFGPLPGSDRNAEGYNPLCGDQISIHLKMEGDRIADIHFEGNGCAISKSSASMMTDVVKGKATAEVRGLFEYFQKMVTAANVGAGFHPRPQSHESGNDSAGPGQSTAPTGDDVDKLAVFSGVAEFPARVKCAILAWHTLKSALERPSMPLKVTME